MPESYKKVGSIQVLASQHLPVVAPLLLLPKDFYFLSFPHVNSPVPSLKRAP